MSDEQHSLLSPSSAARWVECAASVGLEQQYPEIEPDPKAKEGTLAHKVWSASYLGQPQPIEGVTDEMLDGADLMRDVIKEHIGDKVPFAIEHRVDIPAVHPQCWGTLDAGKVDRMKCEIVVIDYKFGHRFVSEIDNWQLIAYTSGLAESVTDDWPVKHIVVQPRSYHSGGPVRVHTMSMKTLRAKVAQLAQAAELVFSAKPHTRANSECRDCRARHVCPSLTLTSHIAIEVSSNNVPLQLSPEAMGRELATMMAAKALLEARISGFEEELANAIKHGSRVHGWAVEQGYGRETWAKSMEEVLALGQMMGIDISKPGALTPKQAIKAGLPEELVRSYSTTPLGSIKLVQDTGAKALRAFGAN